MRIIWCFLILANLLVNVFSPVYAQDLKSGAIKGKIIENTDTIPGIVFFVHDSYNFKKLTFEEKAVNALSEINLSNVNKNTLKISTPEVDMTLFRLDKATAVTFLGGLSVSGNIQNSIAENRADWRLVRNFKRPIKSLKEGWVADDNEFFINYIGHPFEWFMIGSMLKASGASDKEAILISQYTSFIWEYIIEGCYVAPSPKDLAVNSIGSLAGIYLYNVALSKPMDSLYNKFTYLGDKFGMNLHPQIQYNPRTRGMMFAAVVNIKK